MYKDDNHFVETIKVRSRVQSLTHEVFLDEHISESEYYRNVVSLFRNQASENDIVEVYLANGGGSAHTMSVILDAMLSCPAKIVGYISGTVASACTFLTLACDEWVVGQNVQFMIHGASGGDYGKMSDRKNTHKFEVEWHDNLIRNTYKGFLTDEEIELTIEHGKEHWFGSEELTERLANFHQYRQNKQSSALDSLYSAQEENAEKYEKILLDKLVAEGTITEQEKEISLKVQAASVEYDKTLSDEDFDALMNGEDDSKGVALPDDDSLTSFMIYDMNDVEYGIVSYEVLDEEPIRIELELLEDNSCLSINKTYLEDLPKSELKSILDNISVRYAHNSGDKRLAEKVEETITEYAKDHLEENIK